MRASPPTRRHRISLNSFSLVEMVVVIGVISVSLVVVIGMLGAGLTNDHDSSNRLQAADIASLLISTRCASPTNSFANFALPALGVANAAGQDIVTTATGYKTVLADGSVTNVATQGAYNLRYIITPSGSQTNIANVDLVLWWPAVQVASASTMPTNNPSSYYELMTQIALP